MSGIIGVLSKYECYELCVQSPRHVTRLLRALYERTDGAGVPSVLREDFAGTAAVSRRWIVEGRKSEMGARAVAVELDDGTRALALQSARADGVLADLEVRGVDAVSSQVLPSDGCDVVFVGNFSIGYIHERDRLVEYLRRSRRRLALGNGGFGDVEGGVGVFVCDIYDGPHKFDLGAVQRKHPARGPEIIHYTWEHRQADVLTAMVENGIHFRVEVDGEVVQEYPDAFVYHWRLWSIAELRDAMHEAGFAVVEVFAEIAEGARPIERGEDLPASGVVCVAARG